MSKFTELDIPPKSVIDFIYIDESGELGVGERSSSYFLITALCTQNPKALKKRLWKKKAELYGLGWPKEVEIKGTTLWGSVHNPRIPEPISKRRIDHLAELIRSVVAGPIQVHYSIAKKDRLTAHLLRAEYGIAYNYLSGTLLTRAYAAKKFGGLPLSVIVDQRSKETHSKMKFDGYVATKLVTENEHDQPLEIRHLESNDEFGLQAVDFLSWGLFRWFEHRDRQFADLIAPVVGYIDAWYPETWCPGKK